MKIGVFDSGRGGTTVLETVKKMVPEAEYRYIADSKNCPYGEKPVEVLYEILKRHVDSLKEWGASIIIVACNTATVKCIERLRKEYPDLQFVGTEPAVKLALRSGAEKVLVLATPNTIASERLHLLAKKNASTWQKVDFLACPGLAETIEKYHGGDNRKIAIKLNELLSLDDSYDAVVLGCTHYPLIREQIQRFYPNAVLVDGNDGVARRVKALVKSKS